MKVSEYINNLKSEIDMLKTEIDDLAATFGNYSILDPTKKNNSRRYSKVESAVVQREQLWEQLEKLENKLATAIDIIKFDSIYYKNIDTETGRTIELCKIWGMTEREIKNKFGISNKEYIRCQKAFEDYFFSRINGKVEFRE